MVGPTWKKFSRRPWIEVNQNDKKIKNISHKDDQNLKFNVSEASVSSTETVTSKPPQFDKKKFNKNDSKCLKFLSSGTWSRDLPVEDYRSCYYNKTCRETAWNYSKICDVVHFDSSKIKQCLANADFNILGDSRARQAFYVMKAILEDAPTVLDPKPRTHLKYSPNAEWLQINRSKSYKRKFSTMLRPWNWHKASIFLVYESRR